MLPEFVFRSIKIAETDLLVLEVMFIIVTANALDNHRFWAISSLTGNASQMHEQSKHPGQRAQTNRWLDLAKSFRLTQTQTHNPMHRKWKLVSDLPPEK